MTARPNYSASAAQLPTISPGQTPRSAFSHAGAPHADVLGKILTLTEPVASGYPRCWEGMQNEDSEHLVTVCDDTEYREVTLYFNQQLGPHPAQIGALFRVQNNDMYKQYKRDASETVMFHGCKVQANEDAIVQQGFRVDKCRSGGRDFGSWFAVKSSYSDGGFAFVDSNGWRHMFICLVSRFQVKKESATMRVVGQGGAYPQWLVHYRHDSHA